MTFDQVLAAADAIRQRTDAIPDVAIVLGSGLGEFAATIREAITFPYTDIPNWPASTVVGHAGQLVIGTLAGKRVAALSGRAHFYEGHAMTTVTFATRVIGTLGIKKFDPDQRRWRHQPDVQVRHAHADGRSHQPDGQ